MNAAPETTSSSNKTAFVSQAVKTALKSWNPNKMTVFHSADGQQVKNIAEDKITYGILPTQKQAGTYTIAPELRSEASRIVPPPAPVISNAQPPVRNISASLPKSLSLNPMITPLNFSAVQTGAVSSGFEQISTTTDSSVEKSAKKKSSQKQPLLPVHNRKVTR